MALLKEKDTNFGISASYWKVGMITIDRDLKEVSFSLNLYVDKDSKKFLETYIVSSLMGKKDKSLYEKYFGEYTHNYENIYNACYLYVKENEEYFKDSIDE